MRAQGACRQRCQPWFVTAPELQPFPLLFRVPFRVNSSRWELQGPRCVQRMIPDFSAPLWEWNCAGITPGSAPPRAHLALPCPLPSFIQDVDFLLRFHPGTAPNHPCNFPQRDSGFSVLVPTFPRFIPSIPSEPGGGVGFSGFPQSLSGCFQVSLTGISGAARSQPGREQQKTS